MKTFTKEASLPNPASVLARTVIVYCVKAAWSKVIVNVIHQSVKFLYLPRISNVTIAGVEIM